LGQDNALKEGAHGGGMITRAPGDAKKLQSPENARLAITDLVAVTAWVETNDEAAGAWLCQKYRPLILHIAGRQFRSLEERANIADESLRRALERVTRDLPMGSVANLFARVAVQVCFERARGRENGGSEAPAPLAA
jgi:hypothetical protein